MGWRKTLSACLTALAVASCATGPVNSDGSPLPQTTHADLVFVGRIVSSEPIYLVRGDTVAEGWERTFEAVNQPGAKVVAVDGHCPVGELGDKALLVFLERKTERDTFYVYACTVVDPETINSLRLYDRCFGRDAFELNCFKR